MDFFSNVGNSLADPPPTEALDPFAQAIANRFGSAALLTAHLLPEKSPPRKSPRNKDQAASNLGLSLPRIPSPVTTQFSAVPTELTPLSAVSITSQQQQLSFTPVSPSALPVILRDPGNILILDIRPHAAFTSARLPRALSLCVPSTLLKRPLFSLEKLSAMLPSTSSQERFNEWRSASRIIVYDGDAAAIPEGSNIFGLLKKFKKEGFTGDLGWLQGGFQAVWKTQRDLVTSDPPSPSPEPEDNISSQYATSPQTGLLRTRHLPMSAFSYSSTTSANSKYIPALSHKPSTSVPPTGYLGSTSQLPTRPAANPFYDAIRQNSELSQGITERIPLRLPKRVRRRVSDLPFRWLQDIACRAAPRPRSSTSNSGSAVAMDSDGMSSEDESDDDVNAAAVEEGTEALAMQFYRIELAEQRRMQGVMEHHSNESGLGLDQPKKKGGGTTFPYSITAGVEKGAKNRYRHIWPFEHARVRLHQRTRSSGTASPEDDYVNASYVQPIGTSRRYIATQGPLPATFTDFWTLCWEQNVHVIVMLTREVEGATVKSGNYWSSTAFGPLRLKLLSSSGGGSSLPEVASADFFSAVREPKAPSRPTIKRVFELRNTRFPQAKPRIVTHLQYLEWPDMNVPDDPRGVLGLIKEVNAAVAGSAAAAAVVANESDIMSGRTEFMVDKVDSTTGIATHALGKKSPVLLHCSAGVGRTGGFIAIDALLDAIRMDIRKAGLHSTLTMTGSNSNSNSNNHAEESYKMDVDPPIAGTVPLTVMRRGRGECKDHRTSSTGGGNSADNAGLVVHIPYATSSRDSRPVAAGTNAVITPMTDRGMSIDIRDDMDTSPDENDSDSPGPRPVATSSSWVMSERAKPLTTRKWVEAISDSTGVVASGLQSPSKSNSSSSSNLRLNLESMDMSRATPASSQSHGTIGSTPPSTMSSRRNTSPMPTDSSDSGPSRNSTDSLAFTTSTRPDKPTSSLATTMSDRSSQAHLSSPSSVICESPVHPKGHYKSVKSSHPHCTDVDQSKDLKSRRSSVQKVKDLHDSGANPTAKSNSNTSSTVSQRRSEASQLLAPSPTPTKDRRSGSISSSSKGSSLALPPPSSLSSSMSRSASRSDSSEDLSVQRHSSRSSSYPSAVKPGSLSASPPHSVIPEGNMSPPYGADILSKKLVAAKSQRPETSSSDENTSSNDDPPAAIVDYKQPRPLHDDRSPTPLSAYEEPVWQVIQDMREQRMSLCQTLRQYVFVHAAVIEGALIVMDEERESFGKRSPICQGSPVSSVSSRSGSHVSTALSKGKRGASPTELLKKDKKGEVSLAKRPSTKRKQSGLDGRDAIFEMTTTDALDLASPASSRSLSSTGSAGR